MATSIRTRLAKRRGPVETVAHARRLAPDRRPYEQFWKYFQPAAGLLDVLDQLPAAASMSCRVIRRKKFTAFRDSVAGSVPFSSHFPEFCEFEEFQYEYDNVKLLLPHGMKDWLDGRYFHHALAGKPRPQTPWGTQSDLDKYGDPRGLPWELTPWQLLYRCGLVGYPLSSRLVWLAEWGEFQRMRLLALIVRLKMERIGKRLATRIAALAAVAVLSALLGGRPVTPAEAIEPDGEPPPLRPPRAPGVDSPGLFVPRC